MRPTPVVRRTLIALGAAFAVQIVIAAMLGFDAVRYDQAVTRWFALDPALVIRGRLWTVVTYALLHDLNGWGHLLFNGLVLYLWGTQLEHVVASRRAATLMWGGVLAGAAGVFVGDGVKAVLFGEPFGGAVIGASAMATALVAGFCWLHRDQMLQLLMFRLRGWHVLVLFVALDTALAVRAGDVSLWAHAGGYAWGLVWASGWTPRRTYLRWKLARQRRRLRVLRGGADDPVVMLHREAASSSA